MVDRVKLLKEEIVGIDALIQRSKDELRREAPSINLLLAYLKSLKISIEKYDEHLITLYNKGVR